MSTEHSSHEGELCPLVKLTNDLERIYPRLNPTFKLDDHMVTLNYVGFFTYVWMCKLYERQEDFSTGAPHMLSFVMQHRPCTGRDLRNKHYFVPVGQSDVLFQINKFATNNVYNVAAHEEVPETDLPEVCMDP